MSIQERLKAFRSQVSTTLEAFCDELTKKDSK